MKNAIKNEEHFITLNIVFSKEGILEGTYQNQRSDRKKMLFSILLDA